MSEKKYQLKGNSILKDGCFLNSWYIKLSRHVLDFNNPLNNIPPIDMFNQHVDREKIKLIKQKSEEILVIYGELFSKFNKSLSMEDRKNLC